jgi:class 3 adenylate cyclase/tetratricopeptide (TPR) repeat protein
MTEREGLEEAIAALERQRAVIGDAVVDTALATLRAKLARLDTPEQQLKPVTILFTDVVGSMALSQPLDPEDIHAIIDGALQRFTSIVESQRGRVLQYAGDSLLAVFGAIESHEDDPERAVRAGLEILDEAKRLAVQVEARHRRDDFHVRVGIHTGPVLLGGGVDAEGTIRGSAVNIAARMEQTAPVDGLRISHTTYRHVRGMFDVLDEPLIAVKGMADPIRSYVVLRAKPRAFRATNRGVDGAETAMIGRDAEFARLVDIFEAVRTQRALSLVTVVGDAGLGKTRLMVEFERWLDLRPEAVRLFHGRAQPYSGLVPYGLLRDLFGWRFGILDDDSQAVAHAKLVEGVGALFGDRTEEQIALIGQLIGLDYAGSPHISGIAGDGQQIRNRAFHAVAQYFRLLQQDGNTVLVFLDDLHWADDGSLDFINHVVQACRDLPMMVLCFARPTLYERRPSWASDCQTHERIELGPLSKRSSHDLVESLLGRLAPVPAAVGDVVTSYAEGNPYFIEEVVAMLIADGVIVAGGDHWQIVADKLAHVNVPSTLAGVLHARLDGLPPAEKMALQQASVIGHVFWDEPLQRLAPGMAQALDRLMRRDLVRAREPSSFDGVREYAFKHHLLHQVTYDSVLKRDKRQQHRLTAEWLVAKSGERSGEYDGLIADHYERAADTVNAATYWRKDGERAANAYASDAALDSLGRALDLTPASERAARFDLMVSRIHLLNLIGRRREEETEVSAVEELAEILNDDAKRAGAASLRARSAVFNGDYPAAASAAARAVTLAEKTGEDKIALFARSVWASASLSHGDYAGTRMLADALLRSAQAAGHQRRTIDAFHLYGSLAVREGRYGMAREYFGRALQLARSILDKLFESVQLINLGEVERSVGNYLVAADRLETGLQLCREVGAAKFRVHFLLELAELANVRGDSVAALGFVTEGLAVARAISNRDLEAALIVVQGDARLSLGQPIEARDSYRRALGIGRELGRARVPVEPVAGIARVAAALGDIDEGLAHVAQVEARIDAGECVNEAAALLWTCHTVLLAAGAPRANAVLTRAHSLLTEQAKLLDEADRTTFLGNVPSHRAIMTACAAAASR